MLFDENPEATKVQTKQWSLPLHFSPMYKALDDI